MPEQIENMMVVDELWQWKEDPESLFPDRKRMRREMEAYMEGEWNEHTI